MPSKIDLLPNGNYQFRVIESLKKNDVKTVIDVGSNVGNTIIQYYNEYHPEKIYGFEPCTENYNKAKENTKNIPCVELFNVAVSNEDVFGELFLYPSSSGHSLLSSNGAKALPTQDVKIIRLDTWAKELGVKSFDLVKIDVQGNDFRVILGMGDMINTVKIMKVEVWFDHSSYKDAHLFDKVMGFMYDHGFRLRNFPVLTYLKDNRISWGDAIFLRKDIFNENIQ